MSLTRRSYSLMPRARARSMQARQALRSPVRSGSKYCWDRALVTDLDMACSPISRLGHVTFQVRWLLYLKLDASLPSRLPIVFVNLGNFDKSGIGDWGGSSFSFLTC